MIKIGMLIGDRYEILEKIGTGGMSDVYKAKCHKLNRYVAVKVLKQEFSENGNFVSKFIVEAQAAAGHTTATMTLRHYVKGRQQHTNTATPIAAAYGLDN